MLSFLPPSARGVIGFSMFVVNLVFWVTLIFIVSSVRILLPLNIIKRFISNLCISFANGFIIVNNFIIFFTNRVKWDVQINGELKMNDWYLVVSNHQTWIDIVVLQRIFLHKIPFLKFFIKQQLLWVPFIGGACIALEFPFMKRYSKEFLDKNPHLKGKDIEATRVACEKYRTVPTSVMNFTEGTRFTPSKHKRQNSVYENLLKPKAGGISLVMGTMGDILTKMVDVTIYYPDGAKSLWDFLCGRTRRIVVRIDVIPITDQIRGDYVNDPKFANEFQNWLNSFWKKKDRLITELKLQYHSTDKSDYKN